MFFVRHQNYLGCIAKREGNRVEEDWQVGGDEIGMESLEFTILIFL